LWRISVANLRHRPGRFIATTLAVIVGTGFLAGTLVLRDSLGPALVNNQTIALANVSAVVLPPAGNDPDPNNRQASQSLLTIPAATLAEVQRASGVAGAAGVRSGPLKLLGPGNSVQASGLIGQAWIPVAQINPFTIVEGKAPETRGQVVLDSGTAAGQNLSLGSTVTLATTSGPRQATIVGLSNFGPKVAANPQGDVLVNNADAFDYLNSGQQQYTAIYAAAAQGIDQQALASNISQVVGSGFDVQTGSSFMAQQEGLAQTIAVAITTGLQVFAYVALFVAIFIIYNTFTIVVTQRTRELALLRAIGASGRQIKRAIRIEALAVGVIASLIGMVVGIALFMTLVSVVPTVENLIGSSISTSVSVSSVVQVLISGTLITFLSAVLPGWRAARTPPVAAMRVVDVDRSATSRFRIVFGSAMVTTGVVLLVLGAATSTAWIVGVGTLVAFLSVLVGGPVLVHHFTRAVAIPARLAGPPGHLALQNVERNARRTATTANALVIGVFMVVFVTAAGGALRDNLSARLSDLSDVDLMIQAEQSSSIPAHLIDQTRAIPGVTNSASVLGQFAPIDRGFPICAVDFGEAVPVFGLKQAGGRTPLASLSGNQMAVVGFPGVGGGQGGSGPNEIPQLGETVPVTFNNGRTQNFDVVASYQLNFSLPFCMLIPQATALDVQRDLQPVTLGVDVEPGAEEEVRTALDNAVAPYSNVSVEPGNAFAQAIKGVFNFLINSVSALLGVAIVIAVFGIVNTLMLSIVERTREIGVLRAVGMSRAQLRRMVRIESVIVALLGTFLGMGFGLLVAYSLVRPLVIESGTGMTWPFTQLVLILVLGTAIGVIASVIPAWRASRMNPLEAIRD